MIPAFKTLSLLALCLCFAISSHSATTADEGADSEAATPKTENNDRVESQGSKPSETVSPTPDSQGQADPLKAMKAVEDLMGELGGLGDMGEMGGMGLDGLDLDKIDPKIVPKESLDKMKEMEKMMKMMSNMTCLLAMRGYMDENKPKLSALKGRDDAQQRLDKLLSKLYGKCKNSMNENKDDMASMLGDGANYKEMFQEIPISDVLESDPVMSHREQELFDEFSEAEKELAKMKEKVDRDQKKTNSKTNFADELKEPKKTKKSKKKAQKKKPRKVKKKANQDLNMKDIQGFGVLAGLGVFLFWGWNKLSDDQEDPKKNKKKKKNKKNKNKKGKEKTN